MFALGGEEIGPGNNLGVLLEQGAALPLGHSTPHPELDPVVERIGAAFEDHRAVPADHRGFALSGAADEQLVRIGLPAAGLRHPGDTRFCFCTVNEVLSRGNCGIPASGGPCT